MAASALSFWAAGASARTRAAVRARRPISIIRAVRSGSESVLPALTVATLARLMAQSPRAGYAADLKFLQCLPQARLGTSNRKRHWNHKLVPLRPKFV